MAPLRVSRKSFVESYAERTKALSKMVAKLPDRPSPDVIHDLRVVTRRVQMIRRVVPRKFRGSEDSKDFDFALRSILTETSQLRDMDTLVETLKSHRRSVPAELLINLENQRSDAAARAREATGLLKVISVPSLDASELRGRRLSRRLSKRVREHSKEALSLLTVVLDDESKVEDLHSLRKEVKKMRYLIELADKAPARLSALAKWQERLGDIRDLDVAIAHLEEARGDSKPGAILELRRARHSSYLKFVRDCRAGGTLALGEMRSPPMNGLGSNNLSSAEA